MFFFPSLLLSPGLVTLQPPHDPSAYIEQQEWLARTYTSTHTHTHQPVLIGVTEHTLITDNSTAASFFGGGVGLVLAFPGLV